MKKDRTQWDCIEDMPTEVLLTNIEWSKSYDSTKINPQYLQRIIKDWQSELDRRNHENKTRGKES